MSGLRSFLSRFKKAFLLFSFRKAPCAGLVLQNETPRTVLFRYPDTSPHRQKKEIPFEPHHKQKDHDMKETNTSRQPRGDNPNTDHLRCKMYAIGAKIFFGTFQLVKLGAFRICPRCVSHCPMNRKQAAYGQYRFTPQEGLKRFPVGCGMFGKRGEKTVRGPAGIGVGK